MLLKLTLGLFIATVTAIPVVAQINPEHAVDKLAVATAQYILSAMVVVLAVVCGFLYRQGRKDIAHEREERNKDQEQQRSDRKEERTKFEQIITENTAASTQLASTSEQLKESVYHFAKVVETCDHRGDKD